MNGRSAILITLPEPGALPGENFRLVYDLWHKAKGEHELPPASAISPKAIPKALLGDCSIVSVEDGPKRFLIRLVGTRIVQELGFDMTNSWGDDRPDAADARAACIQCIESRLPHYSETSTAWAGNEFKRAKVLMLPYAGADNSVRKILAYMEFCYQRTERM
jgi:hypothetical protein